LISHFSELPRTYIYYSQDETSTYGPPAPAGTNLIWLDLEAASIDKERFAVLAQNAGAKTMRGRFQGRLIIHYKTFDHVLHVLADLCMSLLKGSGGSIARNYKGEKENIVCVNIRVQSDGSQVLGNRFVRIYSRDLIFLTFRMDTSAPSKHVPLIIHSSYTKINCPICKIEVIEINKANIINI
jgi:hypothetical protein